MANPNINQFAQTPVQGDVDLSFVGSVVSARVSANQASALIAGQAVAGDTAAPATNFDGVPPVIALASNATPCIGFVVRNIKDINAPTNARIELAMKDTVMYMTSDSTTVGITRFGPVEYNTSTNTVLAWQGVNPICGYAYDAAILAADLVRVIIASPQLTGSSNNSATKTLNVTATQAQINAGLVLIPGVTGKAINVVNYTARVTGAFATGTAVVLEDTNGTPVVVTTLAQAGLSNGTVLLPGSSNTTLGAGFSTPLTSGAGLQVIHTGTAFTGGTNIQFTISYTQG